MKLSTILAAGACLLACTAFTLAQAPQGGTAQPGMNPITPGANPGGTNTTGNGTPPVPPNPNTRGNGTPPVPPNPNTRGNGTPPPVPAIPNTNGPVNHGAAGGPGR